MDGYIGQNASFTIKDDVLTDITPDGDPAIPAAFGSGWQTKIIDVTKHGSVDWEVEVLDYGGASSLFLRLLRANDLGDLHPVPVIGTPDSSTGVSQVLPHVLEITAARYPAGSKVPIIGLCPAYHRMMAQLAHDGGGGVNTKAKVRALRGKGV